ncbi:M13 family metallopeptidase [Brachymonas denitrificans]|uniref:M13 family metallopeptidase n=1 Tax=Brachymonas denitrificans TaxID=28220 RepID=UPI002AFE4A72|nr:M13-type metalloendopeptidase [Brachymonas denitrificans]
MPREYRLGPVPKGLVLALAVSSAIAAQAANGNQPSGAGASSSTGTYTIDQTKLLPFNAFKVDDLDKSIDACHDFAGYANARFLAANPVPSDRTIWGSFDMLGERSMQIQQQLAEQAAANRAAKGVDKLIGDLYATGMDEARINAAGYTPIKAELDAISRLSNKEQIAEYLRENAAKGRDILFDFVVFADFKAPDMNMAYVGQAGLGLPDKTYYTADNRKDVLAAYEVYVANILKLIGVSGTEAARQAADIVALEKRLAHASLSSEELARDRELEYNPVTLAEADRLTPNFSWTKFFQSQQVAAPARLSLAMPGFHQEVSRMLAEVPVSVWQSYFKYHAASAAAPHLSDAFVQEHFRFYSKALRGQDEKETRAMHVLNAINRGAAEALGQLYVKVAFSPEAKMRMETLVANIGKAFKTRIENLDWMSSETKKRALEKWASFEPRIGYPDKWRSWDGLRTSRDSYYDNLQALQEFNHKWMLGKIGKPVNRTEWDTSPQVVNAYYRPARNDIVFPAAILQPPFFDPNADDAINYGGIGAVIGHEMTHGYDDQGARFDAAGKFENWWTPADAQAFSERTAQLVRQFDGYTTLGENVNGRLTLSENIADLGGLATAYDAMKAATAGKPDPMTGGLTNDQRFFLSWATGWRRNMKDEEARWRLSTDIHAPAQFRVIGAPSNMPAFAAAFNCKPGDRMVIGDADRVDIW